MEGQSRWTVGPKKRPPRLLRCRREPLGHLSSGGNPLNDGTRNTCPQRRRMCHPTGQTRLRKLWQAATRRCDRGRDYQSRRTPYRPNSGSFDTKTRSCASAWAMSMRSKGSRCGPGKAPARAASATVIGSSAKPWCAIAPATSAAINSQPGNLPSRCLVVISQAVAALTRFSFRGSKMAWRTVSGRRLLSVSHQISAWVSSRIRNRNHLPMPSTLPPAAGRRTSPEGRPCP